MIEIITNTATIVAVSYTLAAAVVLSSKYILKMLAIDFHLI